MDLVRFQRELGDVPEVLLHGPAEALATTWNKKIMKALDRVSDLSHSILLSTPHVYRGVEGVEMGEETSRVPWRKLIVHVPATIKAYLVVRVVKYKYFYALIMSTEVCLTTMFRVTFPFSVKGTLRFIIRAMLRNFQYHL